MKAFLAVIFAIFSQAYATSESFSDVIYSNFGPGDSVSNFVYDLGGAEFADPFIIPQGNDVALTAIEVPIDDNAAQDSRIVLNVRADARGLPGDILETVSADVLFDGACFAGGTFNHSCIQTIPASGNTILHPGSAYWLSATAALAGRVDWFVNVDALGIASTRTSSAPVWFNEESTQGVFRLIGTPVPEPSA